MIKQLALIFDLLFFVVAIYLTVYNLLYLGGMKKATKYTGFGLPVRIQQAMRANVLLSVVAICIIGVFAILR